MPLKCKILGGIVHAVLGSICIHLHEFCFQFCVPTDHPFCGFNANPVILLGWSSFGKKGLFIRITDILSYLYSIFWLLSLTLNCVPANEITYIFMVLPFRTYRKLSLTERYTQLGIRCLMTALFLNLNVQLMGFWKKTKITVSCSFFFPECCYAFWVGLGIFNVFNSSCLSPLVFDKVGMPEGGDRVRCLSCYGDR